MGDDVIVEHCSVDRLRRFTLCGLTIPAGAAPLSWAVDPPVYGCTICLTEGLEQQGAQDLLVERFALESTT